MRCLERIRDKIGKSVIKGYFKLIPELKILGHLEFLRVKMFVIVSPLVHYQTTVAVFPIDTYECSIVSAPVTCSMNSPLTRIISCCVTAIIRAIEKNFLER